MAECHARSVAARHRRSEHTATPSRPLGMSAQWVRYTAHGRAAQRRFIRQRYGVAACSMSFRKICVYASREAAKRTGRKARAAGAAAPSTYDGERHHHEPP